MHFIKFVFVAFILVSSTGLGQNLIYKNYNTNHGVPSSEAYALVQSMDGFIWIGTDQGAARFDGKTFESFTTENGLHDNTVLYLSEDSDSALWLATFSDKINYIKNGKVFEYSYSRLDEGQSSLILTNQMVGVDSEGKKWITNLGQNYLFKEGKPDHFSFYGETYSLDTSKFSYGYFFKPFAKNKVISEIISYPKSDNQKPAVLKVENGFILTGNTHLISKNYVFHGLNDGRIVVYESHGDYFIIDSLKVDGPFNLGVEGVASLYEDMEGNIWFATQTGVVYFEKGNLNSKPITFFKDHLITAIIKDTEGNHWFTDHNNGIYLVPSINFRLLSMHQTSGDKRIACLKKGNGKLWFSTIGGEIWSLNENFTPKLESKDERIQYDFYPFEVLSDNNLLVPGGIISSSAETMLSFNGLSTEKGMYTFNNRVFIADVTGILIYSITNRKYEYVSNFHRSKELNLNRTDTTTFGVRANKVIANEKGVWVGTIEGLYKKNGYQFDYIGARNEILTNRIMDLAFYKENYLLIGSKGAGLIIYDIRSEETVVINKSSGLSSNMVRCIYTEDDVVYVGTNKGLTIFQLNEKLEVENLKVIAVHNGLPSNEVNDLMTCFGKIWIATTQGLVYANPQKIKVNDSPPPIHITELSTSDTTYTDINTLLNLGVDDRNVTIRFNGIGFRAGNNMRYMWWNSDSPNDTVYTTSNEVRLTNLAPGKHQFFVWAINEDNYTSVQPAALSFDIPKRFVETITYDILRIIFIFLIASFILFLVYRRKRRILDTKMQTTELKQQALTALMNPHFIYNSLAAIQHLINSGDHEKSNNYLSLFSRLVRQNLNAVRKGKISLESEIERIELYLEIEKMRFGDRLNYQLEFDEELDTIGIIIPSMIIQPFIENAIWHGILPLKVNGHIKISFHEDVNNRLKVMIRDNGIGIKASLNKKDTKRHSSLSLKITEERLQLMGDKMGKSYQVKLLEIPTEKGGGTQVTITLPIFN